MNAAVPILSASEVAILMRCSQKTVEEHARTGDIPGLLWGDGGWVFPAQALYNRLNELAVEQALKRRQPPEILTVLVANPKRARREPPKLPNLD